MQEKEVKEKELQEKSLEDQDIDEEEINSHEHVEILRKKREAQMKLNDDLPDSKEEQLKKKIQEQVASNKEEMIEEENPQNLPFAEELINKIDDKKLAMRLSIVNELIVEKDAQLDLVEQGLDIEGFEGDVENCTKRLEKIKNDREALLDISNNKLNVLLESKAEKVEFEKCIKEIECEADRIGLAEERLIDIYVKGLKDSSKFAKLCKKKVHTKWGAMFIAGEVVIFLLILLIIYLCNK